jgi:hypothetical protein
VYGDPTSTVINDVDGIEMAYVPSGNLLMDSQTDAIFSPLPEKVSKGFSELITLNTKCFYHRSALIAS